MNKIIDILSNICENSFIEAGFQAGFGRVNISNRPDLCEYQCNGAMALARAEHKKPIDIAGAVAERLMEAKADAKMFAGISGCEAADVKNAKGGASVEGGNGAKISAAAVCEPSGEPDFGGIRVFSRVEAVMPGFINMDLSAEFLSAYLETMAADPYCGLIRENGRRIIIDYGGANVAKPLHVGHLRSAVIGEALKRIGAALGNDITGDVHLGDWGLQMGLIIEELKDRNQKEFTISDLEEIYPAASKKSKEVDEATGELTEAAKAFRDRAMEATGRLQNMDPECVDVWKRIMELSKADLKKNYDALDVHFELWKGESDVQKYIPDMLDKMEKDGVAYESRGALVVDVAEPDDTKEIPPCIVRKSDGAALYATTDLATLLEREALYDPDANIYIADQRQSLHYLSFFRISKKAGIVKPDEQLSFLGFGTMNGKDGKPFKTRSGGVMRLEVLIKDIADAVYQKIRETRSEDEISDAEAKEISEIVGLAALKYGDLSNQASKDYVFDIDRFASFEGNTGPYILYTAVRIGSILKKAGLEPDKSVGCVGSEYMQFASVPEGRTVTGAAGSGSVFETAAETACGFEARACENSTANSNGISENDKAVCSAGTGADVYTCGPSMTKAVSASSDAKALALSLTRLNDVVLQSWNELAPHKICQFIYEVSEKFNGFYHNVKILGEENAELKESYISLLVLTRRVLLLCIAMLGFSVPDKM